MTSAKRRTKPQTVVIATGKRSTYLRGPVRVIMPAIRTVGCAWMWDHVLHVLTVPVRFVDDVAAAIELDGHRVDMRGGLAQPREVQELNTSLADGNTSCRRMAGWSG